MSDRELLEKAARAGGIEKCTWGDMYKVPPLPDGTLIAKTGGWNPLTDDGDALRLAVQLRLGIVHGWESFEEQPLATVWISHDGQCLAEEIKGDDPYAATRRAIVRAAAVLGETK